MPATSQLLHPRGYCFNDGIIGGCSIVETTSSLSAILGTSAQDTTTRPLHPVTPILPSTTTGELFSTSLSAPALDSTSENSIPSMTVSPSPPPSGAGVTSAGPTRVVLPSAAAPAPSQSTSQSVPMAASMSITAAPTFTPGVRVSGLLGGASSVVGNISSTSTHPQTSASSGLSEPLQPLVPSATSSSTSSQRVSHIPTPALVAAIACVVLAVLAVVVLLRCLVCRRRRAGARALGGIAGIATSESDDAPLTPMPVRLRAGARSKWQAEDRIQIESTDTHYRPVSGDWRGAQGGGTTAPECAPSVHPPGAIDVDHKDAGYLGQELPSSLPPTVVPPSAELLLGAGDRADSPADQSRATTFSTPSAPGREAADAQGERFLHLALPWIFGQRVLAMMAREDARSVDSDGSEPLPAYEPREQGQGDRL